jgi:four helix bundle protein
MNSFEELKVWQEAHKLVIKIYKITDSFPREERYRLTSQLCRSAASIPANIADGQARQTTKEYLQFLYTARGSIAETKYHLILTRDLGYIENSFYNEIITSYNKVGKMLNALINSLKKRDANE